MLRKILTNLGWTQSKTTEGFPLPYGLDAKEYASMLRLAKSEDFETWRKTLDNVVTYYAESMLSMDDTTQLHFMRGKIQGLRYSLEIVDEIFKKEQDFLINERRRKQIGTNPDRANRATFGTASWKPKV